MESSADSYILIAAELIQFFHLNSSKKRLSNFNFQLNTLVDHVEPEELANGQIAWTVSYTDLSTRAQYSKTFDAVVLCNGHYTVGHMPQIPGIEDFKGLCLHSHQYRIPEMFAGKNVCILGASWSGIDICLEVSKYASKVKYFFIHYVYEFNSFENFYLCIYSIILFFMQIYLSHNLPEPLDSKMSKNVEQRPGIERVNGDTFVFRDGFSAQVDVLIYCTGKKNFFLLAFEIGHFNSKLWNSCKSNPLTSKFFKAKS